MAAEEPAPQPDYVDEMRRRVRVMAAYSGKNRDEFARAAGMDPARLKSLLESRRQVLPTLPELQKMAEVAGVPDRFATHGWDAPLERRVAKLEEALGFT